MSALRKSLWGIPVLFSLACGLVSQTVPTTQPPVPTQFIPLTAASDTPAAATATQVPTDTATLPPTATATEATASPTVDSASATLAAEMGSMGVIGMLSQYYNPVGTPLKSWRDIPIMSQATAGQEFKPQLYAYQATATLAQARAFYAGKASSIGFTGTIATGSGGTGSNATHSVDFVSFPLTIILTSFDHEAGHVLVVIAKVP